ncbi:TlyA family RNA methyltransferase [Microbacterium telephonicum]|uniref:23S rRNA (Cytidine1920-2'-O)/16S rRNA (Cytidine1409-2'-O)-methyltransferase n=1 Tax=Microbacterium telephonicum TaxID=1714841 RepID=A0A498C3P1_9MICO|nr:TlyA family RNA methyltransferase [Microbacterium telephonicum]RLK49743.1 23S rRNA (cytidine1920-2'-O)/16S rRNA (cytidine1409-2'-O)-methyltransferase [Microbacterium telephonicum]
MTARLDAALAARGLARSRTHAAQLIEQGLVTVDGRGVVKASTKVDDDARLAVAASDHYVSRAAHKLIAGLDAFEVPVSGRVALDMGASTGGFTQVLRERGAHPVVAVDVGHGQLSPVVAADPGVVCVEGFNVRYMDPAALAAASGVTERPGLITGDLSFISLTHVLPAVAETMDPDADVVLLVKPQFEVGRTGVREGLVTDAGKRADAVAGVLWSAWDAGLGTAGLIASPIVGTHGNAEYVAWLRPVAATGDAGNPTEWLSIVNRLAGEA